MSKERAKKYNDGDRIGPNKILLIKRTKRVKSTYIANLVFRKR